MRWWLLRQLKSKDRETFVKAAEKAGALREPLAVDLLVEALHSPSEWHRETAARALGEIGDPAAVRHLTKLLQDTDQLVRETARAALAKFGHAPAPRLSQPPAETRPPETPHAPGATPVPAAAEEPAADDIPATPVQTAQEKPEQPPDPAALLLQSVVSSVQPAPRKTRRPAANKGKAFKALDSIVAAEITIKPEAIKDKTPAGQLEDARAIPVVKTLLKDKDRSVRRAAIATLARVASPEVVPLLVGALRDSDSVVVGRASDALLRFSEAAREALRTVVRDEHDKARSAAIEVLRRIDPDWEKPQPAAPAGETSCEIAPDEPAAKESAEAPSGEPPIAAAPQAEEPPAAEAIAPSATPPIAWRDLLQTKPAEDPLPLLHLRDSLYAADLVIAATCELDLFSSLSAQPKDVATITTALGLQARPTDVMMTLLRALGLVVTNAGQFEASPIAARYLTQDSPFSLKPYLASQARRAPVQALLAVLRTGRPAAWSGDAARGDWAQAMQQDSFASEFTQAMDARGLVLAPHLADALPVEGRARLLDIAGGSGLYACAIVARHTQMTAAVLEVAPVDEIARQRLIERGFAEPVAVITGDMLVAIPEGYDLHLLSNVLHDWDEPVVRRILAHSFAALPPGGLVAIHDVHLLRDKSGPLPAAEYSALLMCATEGRCYSVAEIEAFLAEAGFVEPRFVSTFGEHSLISARKPQIVVTT
jgi:HEAT repeat protein